MVPMRSVKPVNIMPSTLPLRSFPQRHLRNSFNVRLSFNVPKSKKKKEEEEEEEEEKEEEEKKKRQEKKKQKKKKNVREVLPPATGGAYGEAAGRMSRQPWQPSSAGR